MKNREKFNKEIKKAIDENVSGNSTMCNFIRKRVLPNLTNQKVDDTKYDYCRDWSCGICGTAFAFWLDEEYKEPPKSEVDWDKVPVDTLVRVRDGELCGERIDGDGCKGDGWYYDGEKRPDNCPLMEVEDE